MATHPIKTLTPQSHPLQIILPCKTHFWTLSLPLQWVTLWEDDKFLLMWSKGLFNRWGGTLGWFPYCMPSPVPIGWFRGVKFWSRRDQGGAENRRLKGWWSGRFRIVQPAHMLYWTISGLLVQCGECVSALHQLGSWEVCKSEKIALGGYSPSGRARNCLVDWVMGVISSCSST